MNSIPITPVDRSNTSQGSVDKVVSYRDFDRRRFEWQESLSVHPSYQEAMSRALGLRKTFDKNFRVTLGGSHTSSSVRGSDPSFLVVHSEQFESFKRGIAENIKASDETKLKFERLSKQWRDETEAYSSITRKIAHPCYLKIIAMGERAVPLILNSLKEHPDHWFPALNAIIDENPVQPGSSFNEAADAWLHWGKLRGFVV
ncbi:MAG: hypothetical protein HC910_07795 [Spirulinaceae cyanobacterium SM2_1_0]|nr:hypothetical protein [Spirulinaceae cyanobacterium SM2_1_0]